MPTTIKCTNCATQIEITQALKQELEADILERVKQAHQQQIQKLESDKINALKAAEDRFKSAQIEIRKKARAEAIEKIRQEYDTKIETTKEEAAERLKQNQELQTQVKDLLIALRQSRDAQSKLEIEYQQKLLKEQDKIKQEAKKEAHEELTTRIAEKDKKIQDAQKQILELQRKIDQGSQQTQGEVDELKLEQVLTQSFPHDTIAEVPKGIRGADVIQKVYTKSAAHAGTIIWESKNTKNFSIGWISKLKDDQRSIKAEIAILVTKVLPSEIESFGMYQGVWVCSQSFVVGLASALRQQLVRIHAIKLASQGKADKAEVVYNYLISNEFRQRIEVWVEYYQQRRLELDKEKMYYHKKWDKEQKNLDKVLQNTAGFYGDLQGLIGSALPKVTSLELPEEI